MEKLRHAYKLLKRQIMPNKVPSVLTGKLDPVITNFAVVSAHQTQDTGFPFNTGRLL